jgi:hypothetical protein
MAVGCCAHHLRHGLTPFQVVMCCRPTRIRRAFWFDIAELVNGFTYRIATPGIRVFRLNRFLDMALASRSPRSPEASGCFRVYSSSVEAFMSRVGVLLCAHHLVPDSNLTFILSASSTSLSSSSSANLTRGLGVQAMLGPRTKSCGMMSKGLKSMQLTLRIAIRRDSF